MYCNTLYMTIKYGELTIIYTEKEQSIIETFFSWINEEQQKKKPSKYIFLFDDETIYDESTIKDFKYEFLNSCLKMMPRYFRNKEFNKIYFCKSNYKEKTQKIEFDNLFMSYPKYDSSVDIKSVYNEIYYSLKIPINTDVFGIIRIASSDIMPRFQFAYDADEFTKEEVSYLIYHIFNECIK
jgi:hypothetical protein